MPAGPIAGRVAAVTRAGNPVGRAVVAALRDAGATVVGDATNPTPDVDTLVGRAVERHGRLDVMVNGLDLPPAAPAADLAPSTFNTGVAASLTATFYGCRAAARQMLRQPPLGNNTRGVIVNLSSVAGTLAIPGHATLVAAAAGIDAVTRNLANEWRPDGIRVVGLAVGLSDELLAGAAEMPGSSRRVSAGAVVSPDSVASALLFLLGDDAAAITGSTLAVDGGWLVDGYWLG